MYIFIKKKEASLHWFKIRYCKKWPKLWNFEKVTLKLKN